jgi:hypothetical protein
VSNCYHAAALVVPHEKPARKPFAITILHRDPQGANGRAGSFFLRAGLEDSTSGKTASNYLVASAGVG